MNLSPNDIRAISKSFSILYVEDEPDVRTVVTKILNAFFDDILIAENGEVGLELFQKNMPDIVMTDIRMPIMNGLDMAKQIKEISPKTQIIITTAFNDEKYFLKAIDLGIDKYIIKPIMAEPMLSTIYNIVKRLQDDIELDKFKRKDIEDKINSVSQSVVSDVVNAFPNPVITYKNDKVLFTNSAFLKLLDTDDIDKINSNSTFSFNNVIEKRDGFLSNIEDYSDDDVALNRVSIKHKYGHQIFLLHKKVIGIGREKNLIELFSLSNISLQEYQKNKLKTYTEMLEEFIFQSKYSKTIKPVVTKANIEKNSTEIDQPEIAKLGIDTVQMASLRKSHTIKTSADSYIAELDVETLQDMQELNDLERELEDMLAECSNSKEASEIYMQIAQKFHEYAQTIQILIEFDELAFAIQSFSNLLMQKYLEIDNKTHKKLTIFIKNFLEDLVSWRQTIFITQSTIDIHYLDSSLLSAILQVEISLTPGVNEIEDDDNDDLVLF